MRIIKPSVVKHGEGHAVYSMDFQPPQVGNTRRIATAGGDATVKIWDMDALAGDPEGVQDSLLATLEYHSKSVNVCRWSSDGSYLASGSDDTYVIVWMFTPDVAVRKVFGSSAESSKESWSRKFTLHGHRMDVLDVAWSVSNLLASASIDNSILIWDVPPAHGAISGPSVSAPTGGMLSPIRILNGHSSFVKGVSFDPIGRHLASCGADNKLLLWNTESWQIIQSITEPLNDSVDMTMFRRLDWAPDGGSLCLTSSVKNSKPIGMVIARSSWEQAADLVGHDAPTTCSRFFGNVMEIDGRGGSQTSAACVVALGDQHGLLSVWTTNRKMPVIVARDLFTDAVVDIGWGSIPFQSAIAINPGASTAILGACSLDGTIALLLFDPIDASQTKNIFGREMNSATLDKHFMAMYHQKRRDLIYSNPSSRRTVGLSDKVSVGANSAIGGPSSTIRSIPLAPVSMQFTKPSGVISAFPASIRPVVKPASAAPVIHPNSPLPRQAISVRPKDGKKRIAPMSIGGPAASTVPRIPAAAPIVRSNAAVMDTDMEVIGDSYVNNTGGESPSKRRRLVPEATPTSSVPLASTQITSFLEHSPVVPSTLAAPVSLAAPKPVTAVARAGQVVQNLLPGTVDAVKGGVLQYTVNTDNIMSQHVVSDFSTDEEAALIVHVSSSDKSQDSVWSPRMTFSNTNDATLTVNLVARPRAVSQAYGSTNSDFNRLGLSAMSLISFRRPGGRPNVNSSSPQWSTILPTRLSVGCALRLPQPVSVSSNPYRFSTFSDASLSTSNRAEGVAFFGGVDGSLHVLSLSSGLRIYPALVLGAPVVAVSCYSLSVDDEGLGGVGDKHDSDVSMGKEYYCTATCADGEVVVWRIETIAYKPSDESRPNSSGSRSNGIRAAFIARKGLLFSGLSLVFRANVRPVIGSLRYVTEGATSSAKIDKVFLTNSADLSGQKQVVSHKSGDIVLVAVVYAKDSIGGDWQVFRYIPASGCWTQVADMKYILSSAGAPPSLTTTTVGADSTIVCYDMDLESFPREKCVVQTQDVVSAARIMQQEKIQRELGRISAPRDSSVDRLENGTELSHFDWGGMVSLCHAEEKMSNFFYELGVQVKVRNSTSVAEIEKLQGSTQGASRLGKSDLEYWLREWIQFSCKVGTIENVKWLSDKLLQLSGGSGHSSATLSNISPHGTPSSRLDLQSPTADRVVVDTTPESREPLSVVNKWSYITSADSALELLRDVVVPAIGRSGSTENTAVQALLQQIDDALQMK